MLVADVDASRRIDSERLRSIQLCRCCWSTVAFVAFLTGACDRVNNSITADFSNRVVVAVGDQ